MTRSALGGGAGGADHAGMSHSNDHAFQTLVAHFEANEFRFHADPESKSVQLFVTGEAVVYNCRVQITHQDELIQVRIHYPVVARDPKIRPYVAEALARANHGLSIGNFDIDMDSGDIDFHLGQVIRGQGLGDEVIAGVFSAALAAADRYFPAIVRVMFAGHTPADAVYLSELDVHAEAVEPSAEEPAPAAHPPKPVAKRPKAPRKDRRSKTTSELPGLFDDNPDREGGGPRRR
jgi:hypothetical protein